MSIFDTYNEHMSDAEIRKGTSSALKWYEMVLKNNSRITPENMIAAETRKITGTVVPGKMYLYKYDAKHKSTLPYWDMFPLIIMVGPAKGGFHGMNLHYLPYKLRIQLLGSLINLSQNDRFTEKTKIATASKALKQASSHKLIGPCFKHYLSSHVKTKFIQIHPQDWEMSVFMPLAKFQKENEKFVWSVSQHLAGMF